MFWFFISVVSLIVIGARIANRVSPDPVSAYLGHMIPALPCFWGATWFIIKLATAREVVYRDIPWLYLSCGTVLWTASTAGLVVALSTEAGRDYLGHIVGDLVGRLKPWGRDNLPGNCLAVFAVLSLVTAVLQGWPRFDPGFIGSDLEELKVSAGEGVSFVKENAKFLAERALGRRPSRPVVAVSESILPLSRYPRTWFWILATIGATILTPLVWTINRRDEAVDAWRSVGEAVGLIKGPLVQAATAAVAPSPAPEKEKEKEKEKSAPKPATPPPAEAPPSPEHRGATYWVWHLIANLISDSVVARLGRKT